MYRFSLRKVGDRIVAVNGHAWSLQGSAGRYIDFGDGKGAGRRCGEGNGRQCNGEGEGFQTSHNAVPFDFGLLAR